MPTMGMTFDVTIEPLPAILVADFNAGAEQIRSFREPLKNAIQGVIAPSLKHNFSVGGRPPWEPLAESTISKKGFDTILVDTGKLEQIAGQLNIWFIDGGYLSEGNTASAYISDLQGADYGQYHQDGTKHMPARPWAILQPEDVDDIQSVFEAYINQRIGRTLLRGAV